MKSDSGIENNVINVGQPEGIKEEPLGEHSEELQGEPLEVQDPSVTNRIDLEQERIKTYIYSKRKFLMKFYNIENIFTFDY